PPEPTAAAPAPPAARRTWLRRLAALRLRRAEWVFVVALTGFAALAILAHLYAYFGWDVATAHALQHAPVPGLFTFMRAVSIFGNSWHPFALTTATALVLLVRARRTEAAGLVLSAGGGSLVNTIVKLIVARPRPAATLVSVYRPLLTKSFPSGHVTFYVCYFGFLFFAAYAVLPPRTWARRLALAATALPVATVGLSRVYLGAHWPSDTLGAYLLSGLWLACAVHLYRKWKERSTLHPEDKPGVSVR
ncbi:MAG TPA: phosphatase PAP2 family protein, partial [Pyrinomonadaceae bacterium]|nr:phosphatase PAP2 family protein [Pyrinomonadaceae bacterium]